MASDRALVYEGIEQCGAFSDEEVRVAIEMFDAGLAGDYSLIGIETGGVLRAYACVGKAALTERSWYLYWICVPGGAAIGHRAGARTRGREFRTRPARRAAGDRD
jgi:hypothetical protein